MTSQIWDILWQSPVRRNPTRNIGFARECARLGRLSETEKFNRYSKDYHEWVCVLPLVKVRDKVKNRSIDNEVKDRSIVRSYNAVKAVNE